MPLNPSNSSNLEQLALNGLIALLRFFRAASVSWLYTLVMVRYINRCPCDISYRCRYIDFVSRRQFQCRKMWHRPISIIGASCATATTIRVADVRNVSLPSRTYWQVLDMTSAEMSTRPHTSRLLFAHVTGLPALRIYFAWSLNQSASVS